MRCDLKTERRMPYILATLSGIAAGIVVWLFDQPELPRTVPVATMTVGIVVSSFTATQRNMLLGMNTSVVLRRASRANYLEHIFDYLKQTIWFGMATTVVSVIGLFVDGQGTLASIWLVSVVVTIILIVVSTIRNERIMFSIVKRFMDE